MLLFSSRSLHVLYTYMNHKISHAQHLQNQSILFPDFASQDHKQFYTLSFSIHHISYGHIFHNKEMSSLLKDEVNPTQIISFVLRNTEIIRVKQENQKD